MSLNMFVNIRLNIIMASGKFDGYRSENININKKSTSPSYAAWSPAVAFHPDTFRSNSDICLSELPAFFSLVYVVTGEPCLKLITLWTTKCH